MEFGGERVTRVVGAMLGGFAGMAVMSIAFVLLEVETRYEIGIFASVAEFVMMPDNVLLGFLVFVVFGAVVWPLLFVAVEDYIPKGPDPAKRGLVFGSLLWVLFVATASDVSGAALLIYGSLTLVAHLAYGFVLGAVYGWVMPGFSAAEVREAKEVP